MYNREFSYFERYVSTAKDRRKRNDLGYDFLTRNGTKIEEKVSSLQLRKDGYLFYQFGRISEREKRRADRFIFFCDAEDRGLIIFDVPAEKLREKLGERTNLTIPAGSAHYCYGRTKHAWLDASGLICWNFPVTDRKRPSTLAIAPSWLQPVAKHSCC
jgi:hypothetical protein